MPSTAKLAALLRRLEDGGEAVLLGWMDWSESLREADLWMEDTEAEEGRRGAGESDKEEISEEACC